VDVVVYVIMMVSSLFMRVEMLVHLEKLMVEVCLSPLSK